jgi:polyhydroxyalkanoate synthesis regulator phasin
MDEINNKAQATQVYLTQGLRKKKDLMGLNVSRFLREMIELEWKYRNHDLQSVDEKLLHLRREVMILEKKKRSLLEVEKVEQFE